MSNLSDIQHKLELLMFNSLIAENHIIEDDGTFNVPVEGHNNMRYTFIDTPEYGSRSPLDIQKLQFLNSVMDIFEDIHQYIYYNDPNNKPMYFLPHTVLEEQEIQNNEALLSINTTEHHNDMDEQKNIIIEQQKLIETDNSTNEGDNIVEGMQDMEI
jgi:hypothetical protein